VSLNALTAGPGAVATTPELLLTRIGFADQDDSQVRTSNSDSIQTIDFRIE